VVALRIHRVAQSERCAGGFVVHGNTILTRLARCICRPEQMCCDLSVRLKSHGSGEPDRPGWRRNDRA
jgi:hypothetical protein